MVFHQPPHFGSSMSFTLLPSTAIIAAELRRRKGDAIRADAHGDHFVLRLAYSQRLSKRNQRSDRWVFGTIALHVVRKRRPHAARHDNGVFVFDLRSGCVVERVLASVAMKPRGRGTGFFQGRSTLFGRRNNPRSTPGSAGSGFSFAHRLRAAGRRGSTHVVRRSRSEPSSPCRGPLHFPFLPEAARRTVWRKPRQTSTR